ncbi:MAG: hypothetical protein AAGE52_19245 [Myxococcota bacterium]
MELRPWRFRKVGAVIGLVLFLMPVGWVLAHRLRPMDDPRWTVSDLGPACAESLNGWALLQTRVRLRDLSDEARDVLIDAEVELDASFLERLRDQVGSFEEELESEAELRLQVAARPRFVDNCDPSGMVACTVLPILDLWRQRALAVMIGAVRGRWDAVDTELEAMWIQAVDYGGTCRTIVSCVAAPALLRVTLVAAEVAAQLRQEGFAELAETLEETDLERINLAEGLIGEYLVMRDALRSGEGGIAFDIAHTERLLRRNLELAHTYATTSGPRPYARMQTERALWWVYNPQGKLFVDQVTALDYAEHVDVQRRQLREVRERRDEVVRRLREPIAH